jgi:hypothetical protein
MGVFLNTRPDPNEPHARLAAISRQLAMSIPE